MESKPVIAIEQDADGWIVDIVSIGDATSHADARALAQSQGLHVVQNWNGVAKRDLTRAARAAGRGEDVYAILVERVQ